GRGQPLPAGGGHEHRGEHREDPAHLPRPREAALGPLDEARRGSRPARLTPPRLSTSGPQLLAGWALLPALEVDVERVDELAEDGQLLVRLIAGAGAVRLHPPL